MTVELDYLKTFPELGLNGNRQQFKSIIIVYISVYNSIQYSISIL